MFYNFLRQLLLGPAYFYHRYLIAKTKQQSDKSCFITSDQISLTAKKDYYISGKRFFSWFSDLLVKRVSTGGSTGTPFVFEMDTFWTRQKERAYIFDVWSEVGYRPFDKRVVFRGGSGKTLIKYDWLENCYVVTPSLINSDNLHVIRNRLISLNGFYLHVYPSSLTQFINIFGDNCFADFKVKGILAGSERFPLTQMHHIESKYGVKVCHWYGHSEYVLFAKHCRVCNGFHFYPSYGQLSLVLDKHRNLFKIVGTSSRIVGTKFRNYDTGDYASLSSDTCKEPFFAVASIDGREQEFFIDKFGSPQAFGPYLFGIHNQFWEYILSVQFIQKHKGALDVHLVMADNTKVEWIETYLRERFSSVQLSFKYITEISKTAAGKHRYFISEI